MTEDIVNDKGKIVRFANVHCIEKTEELARQRSNLDDTYSLVKTYSLGRDWQ